MTMDAVMRTCPARRFGRWLIAGCVIAILAPFCGIQLGKHVVGGDEDLVGDRERRQ